MKNTSGQTVSQAVTTQTLTLTIKGNQHEDICKVLNDIYRAKNADYNDSFGKSFQEYGMIMAAIRLEDKLNRFKALIKQEAKVLDESIEDTLMDLANYSIMTLIEIQNSNKMS